MELNLKDTGVLLLVFLFSIVLFYAYLIQYLAQVQGKDIKKYPLGSVIMDSNLFITIGAGVAVLFLGMVLVDDLKNNSNKLKNTFF
jgi:hypothetical protein